MLLRKWYGWYLFQGIEENECKVAKAILGLKVFGGGGGAASLSCFSFLLRQSSRRKKEEMNEWESHLTQFEKKEERLEYVRLGWEVW
jgi:hypothetical protein